MSELLVNVLLSLSMYPSMQEANGSGFQEKFEVMKRFTSFMESCHGQLSSSQASSWPERDSPFLKSWVDTSHTSTQMRPSLYGTNRTHSRSQEYEQRKMNISVMFLLLLLSFRKLFSDANGNLLKPGDIVKFEKLADTLEMIADQGADVFYTGRIAEDLIRDVQEAGIVRRDALFSRHFLCLPDTMI